MAAISPLVPALQILDSKVDHAFQTPVKKINDGDDVTFFLASKAYADIMTFIFQLNTSMLPRRRIKDSRSSADVKAWKLDDPDVPHPPVVQSLGKLLEVLTTVIDEAPPDKGPRRFGNISFRVWYGIVRERIPALLDEYLPAEALTAKSSSETSAKIELEAYLLGSFGSSQRLDYGTGHELSFLAFLGCLWKLGAFPPSQDGDQERGIVLGVIQPYLVLIRRLILTYTLEPAGSHGVWGLDDHSFAPYIFGSAQLSPPIVTPADVVTEGSLANAPNPTDIAKKTVVDRERNTNMYFSAIGFIYDVKKGPFWEHSPILFDISGVKAGWAKINKGMIKMYNVEVLSKFPVVQHFPFGSLFSWEKDPNAKIIASSVHTSSQPQSTHSAPTSRFQQPLRDPIADGSSLPPMNNAGPTTRAPWASGPTAMPTSGGSEATTRAPWASNTGSKMPPGPTGAPWAQSRNGPGTGTGNQSSRQSAEPATKAPWANSTR